MRAAVNVIIVVIQTEATIKHSNNEQMKCYYK